MMPLSHAINSELAKATGTGRLAGFHVGNIVIHIASAILVYFLFCLLQGQWGPVSRLGLNLSERSLAAALVFAVHPIAGSAVNYMAARDLLLMVFFFLAAMLVYINMRRTGDTLVGWLVSLLLLSLAILSKQAAIMGFGLIFLFEWILVDVKLRNWKLWARTTLFALPTVAYFALRWLWIVPENTDSARTINDLTYAFTMLDAHLFYYARNFVWPFEMRALGEVETIKSILQPTALAGLCFIIATLFVAWSLRARQQLVTFAILAYWLLFSLTSSVFPFPFVVTDYRQYLPLVFLSLVITQLLCHFAKREHSIVLLSALILYFSISSYYLNTHWRSEESYWQQSVKFGAVALAHQNYALAVADRDPALAEHHYREAIRKSPFHIFAHINLGMLQLRTGREVAGLERLRRMAMLNPDQAVAHYWLSKGLEITGKKTAALRETQKAADLDPRSLKYQYAAARALQDAGQHAEATRYFKRIISHDRAYKSTGFWLAFAYQKSGQSQLAIDAYGQFLKLYPDDVQSHFNLAYELMVENDCHRAVAHFLKVLELRPEYREAQIHLSRCDKTRGPAATL